MDLLTIPIKPNRPLGKTPYYPATDERWDLGPFLSYANRKDVTGPSVSLDQQHVVYTTWLYIGLLCEFLCMNASSDGNRLIPLEEAQRLLEAIYGDCVTTIFNDDDSDSFRFHYLNGQAVLGLMPNIQMSLNFTADEDPRIVPATRYGHLAECLQLTSRMISGAHKGFSSSLKLAICALGECLSFKIQQSKPFIAMVVEGISTPAIHSDWKKSFFAPDGGFEKHMLDRGWCRSDLSRVNALYQRLHTLFYLSLMDRIIPGRDHSGCNEHRCSAGQIVDGTYKLSHDPALEKECGCEEMEVDLVAVNSVLADEDLKTFPVLVVEQDESGKVVLKVRPFTEKVKYVAISHVWADGLGNTKANTLQTCQVARLGRLVKAVEDDFNAKSPEQPPVKYCLWIDTLCVPVAPRPEDEPVDPERLRIYHLALGRMKDVYVDAAHVLVLDKALMIYEAETRHPAEALLRIFASSQWMRRLWCLQEGVFAQSLYFQFQDGPINPSHFMTALENTAKADFRYHHIIGDLTDEFNRLDNNRLQQRPRNHDFLLSIQSALSYRAVTVPSDEPLCIATLFGLDVPAILAAPRDLESRMKLIWQMIQSEVGSLPALVIFRADNTISSPGWGWASKTFLLSGHGGSSIMMPGYKTFHYIDGHTKHWLSTSLIPTATIIPDQGLELTLPGLIIESATPSPSVWDRLITGNDEPYLCFYNETEQTWYKIVDWYRLYGTAEGGPRESEPNHQLFHRIVEDLGKAVLLRSEEGKGNWAGSLCLLGRPTTNLQNTSTSSPTPIRWLRKVILSPLSQHETIIAQTLTFISRAVAESPEAKSLTQTLTDHQHMSDGEFFKSAREKLRTMLKTQTIKEWDSCPDFAEAVTQVMGEGMREYIWAGTAVRYGSYRVGRNVGGKKGDEGVKWVVS
ncbi:hypothetical protein QBC38DRAFT_168864 [Podospora fimiseda]|uniref:Heterokaryon incompatibility domain-containing protein n=1 Tax=Podospora fimiseda TaxID=252190 RepID=A0AAN7BS87_9PEZI|nr:hypothetical protein QBC38DRAFT_168864 [Podospora fimiseda]